MGAPGGAQSGTTPPYGIILRALRGGRVIPFLGAGASRVGYREGDPAYLPSGSSLAKKLAREAAFPSDDEQEKCDLSKVSSYYVDVSSRDELRRELRSVFVGSNYRCNDLHHLLAQVADNMMIVTTNYDTLLEQAFAEAGKPYDLVVYPADNEEYANAILWWRHGAERPETLSPGKIDVADLGKTNLIYKMHGSVRPESCTWDSFVITEEDYVDFLSRIDNAVPPAFHEFFGARSFLFLGYGLRDWNLRVLLRKVKTRKLNSAGEQGSASRAKSWAILFEPSPFERTLWGGRDVDIYNLKLEDFVATLRGWNLDP